MQQRERGRRSAEQRAQTSGEKQQGGEARPQQAPANSSAWLPVLTLTLTLRLGTGGTGTRHTAQCTPRSPTEARTPQWERPSTIALTTAHARCKRRDGGAVDASGQRR